MNNKRPIRTQVILKPTGSDRSASSDSAKNDIAEALELLDDFKYYLTTGPANWLENQIIRRYHLNSDLGFVSCVFWNNMYYMTGTDIVKCCVYRMKLFGRVVIHKKKFEEGIFSDLRNLKCETDATLEQPKSEFLQFLLKNACLKTQKKQKVFFWFSIPHDKIFADALERDLKREQSGQQTITKAVLEPSLSFKYVPDVDVPVYEQVVKHIERIKKQFNIEEQEKSSPSNVKKNDLGPDVGIQSDAVSAFPEDTHSEFSVPTQSIGTELGIDESEKPAVSQIDEPKETEVDENRIPPDYLNFEIEYPEGFAAANKTQSVRFKEEIYHEDNIDQNISKESDIQRTIGDHISTETFEIKDENNQESHNELSVGNEEQTSSKNGNNITTNSNGGMSSQVLYTQANTMPIYFNVVQPPFSAYNPFESEVTQPSVNHPLVGLEALFSPQNIYNKDNMFRQPGMNGTPISQFPYSQPVYPSGIQNPATPGFRNPSIYPWIQSPFMPVGNIIPGNMFFPQMTPTVRNSVSYQNSNPAKVHSSQVPSKVRKLSHNARDGTTTFSKAGFQNKINSASRQVLSQVDEPLGLAEE